MKSHWNLSTKITATILGVFLTASITLFCVQQYLYSQSFHKILAEVESSVLELKRQAARDILEEVKIATRGSLERGEFAQFTRFAEQQRQLAEVQEFSFFNENGKAELSSKPEAIGSQMTPELRQRAEASTDLFVVENAEQFGFYYPLRVDTDMHRLAPNRRVGQLHGVLYLAFSKKKVNETLADAVQKYREGANKTFTVTTMIAVIASALCALLAMAICRKILRPLWGCRDALKRLAARDFTQKCDVASTDEIGQMAAAVNESMEAMDHAFRDAEDAARREKEIEASRAEEERRLHEDEARRQREQAENDRICAEQQRQRQDEEAEKQRQQVEAERQAAEALRRKVDHLLEVIAAAARGDLTKQVLVEGNEPVDELASGIRQMLRELAQIIGQVTSTAAHFHEGSSAIAKNAQLLTDGAQSQGQSVGQMTAAIAELTSSVNTVKANAHDAEAMARQTNDLAVQGGTAVQKSIEAMKLIRDSSRQIGEITRVISEIAGQTNLLALNAAIEAARAGEHGLGFAVVADEVRKLAERSNQASREISKLIQESGQRVEEGSQLSDETIKALKQIIGAIESTGSKITEIAATTIHQASTAEEVSRVIQSVAQVTERVTTGSEQMASSSEELGQQAATLRNLVTRFTTQ